MKDLAKYYKQIRDSVNQYDDTHNNDWTNNRGSSIMEDYDKWIKEQRQYWNAVSAMEFAYCSLVHKHIKGDSNEHV